MEHFTTIDEHLAETVKGGKGYNLSIDNQGSIIQISHTRISAMGATKAADLKHLKQLFRKTASKRPWFHYPFFRTDD